MQIVRVEFETDCRDAQAAVNLVEMRLPNLRNRNESDLKSWNVYQVDESVTTMVSHLVEDGKVIKNHG